MDFDVFVAKSWVVESTDAIVDDFIDGDVGVFPGEEDAAMIVSGGQLIMQQGLLRRRTSVSLRNGILKNRGGNSAGARV